MGIYDLTVGKITKDRELHFPGYQFCGPGTHVDERIGLGQRGINELDNACMYHDIAYKSEDIEVRKKADIALRNQAARVFFDTSHPHDIKERGLSLLTGVGMHYKHQFGFY